MPYHSKRTASLHGRARVRLFAEERGRVSNGNEGASSDSARGTHARVGTDPLAVFLLRVRAGPDAFSSY